MRVLDLAATRLASSTVYGHQGDSTEPKHSRPTIQRTLPGCYVDLLAVRDQCIRGTL